MLVGISDEISELRKYLGDHLISVRRGDRLIDKVFEEAALITMLKMCIYDWVLETLVCQDDLRDELIDNIIHEMYAFTIRESVGDGKVCTREYGSEYLNERSTRTRDEDTCYDDEIIVGSDDKSPISFNSEDEMIEKATDLAYDYYDLIATHVVDNPDRSIYRIITRFRRLFYRKSKREISHKDKIEVNIFDRTVHLRLHDERRGSAIANVIRTWRRDL